MSEPQKNQPDLYAVVGSPINHSKSPIIHHLFAKETQQNIRYEAIEIDTEQISFKIAVEELKRLGYLGLNVTLPFKMDAFEYANKLTPRAEIAQAVNTLIFNENGQTLGDNTDGVGLVNDIEQNAHYSIYQKSVLILGAGGAVQGILQPLLEKNPSQVHIANRNKKRAEVLCSRFQTQVPLSASGWQGIPLQGFDIIINGTSASLEGKTLPIAPDCLKKASLVYDMMYGKKPTPFILWAKEHQPKCTTRDGLGMLVTQAAESFNIWRKQAPDSQKVIDIIRQL